VASFEYLKNKKIRLFSSHAPAKKDDHHGHEAAAHYHGHGHKQVEIPKEILDKYKKEPAEHLFPHEDGDYIPPTETHAVGNEKLEIDFGPFDTTVLSGHFGTREKPIEVPSRFSSRIIGCTGSESVEHELLWHEVKEGKDLICMECSQVFRHARIPGFEHFGGHHEHHEEHPFSGHTHGDGFRYMYPPKTSAERAAEEEQLKKDPKAKNEGPSHGVDYHEFGQHTDEEEGRLAASSPVFQDRRPQTLKDRK